MKLSPFHPLLTITTAAALAAAPAAIAQEPLQLVILTNDGNLHTLAAESLSMSVKDQTLLVNNLETSLTLNLPDLDKMYFTGEETGVANIIIDENTAGPVEVFAADGKAMGRFDSTAAARATLPAGIYLLRTSDNKSFKIAVK